MGEFSKCDVSPRERARAPAHRPLPPPTLLIHFVNVDNVTFQKIDLTGFLWSSVSDGIGVKVRPYQRGTRILLLPSSEMQMARFAHVD